MKFDSFAFRRALGSFATGVAVVTARDLAGALHGITVNSFSSVSLDPPLILFCLDKSALSFDAFRQAGRFAVNVLCERQHELSIRFSTAAADKWEGIDYDLWPGDLPVLRGCLANMACRRATLYEGGDHIIILGQVEQLQVEAEGDPLVYFQSGYRSIGSAV
jgi:flavin reductase (DIM6/NTAB) family NADH-FMN oxidoreductase RutF